MLNLSILCLNQANIFLGVRRNTSGLKVTCSWYKCVNYRQCLGVYFDAPANTVLYRCPAKFYPDSPAPAAAPNMVMMPAPAPGQAAVPAPAPAPKT